MARQAGLEPATYCLEGSCSILLSYWRVNKLLDCEYHNKITIYEVSVNEKEVNGPSASMGFAVNSQWAFSRHWLMFHNSSFPEFVNRKSNCFRL